MKKPTFLVRPPVDAAIPDHEDRRDRSVRDVCLSLAIITAGIGIVCVGCSTPTNDAATAPSTSTRAAGASSSVAVTDSSHFVGAVDATTVGELTPTESQDAETDLKVPTPEGTASELLAGLRVQDLDYDHNYSREEFGPAWADIDHNGCDTRNDILTRDLTDKSYRDNSVNCIVTSGKLSDPYFGKQIDFTRGPSTSTDVQIDHIVALANAWQSGAATMPYAARVALANDPLNLLAVDGSANQEKKAKDASRWLPRKEFRCEYVTRQIQVKAKYGLNVTPKEKVAMTNVLEKC